MYSTCLFCNGRLGANEIVERLPIGRRIAFDAANGRLWVVCPLCERWNLTPIEDRHEAIEECEKLFRGTYVRVSTGNIGLARLYDSVDLIRIGKPLRPEFAAWRYAGEFLSRRTRSYAIAGATFTVGVAASATAGLILGPLALASGVVSLVAIPGVTTLMVAIPALGGAIARDYLTYDRVVARFVRGHHVVRVRAKHVQSIYLEMIPGGDPTVSVQHDGGRIEYTGTMATHAATVILANSNRHGADRNVVRAAVAEIEDSGNAEGFLETASRRNGWRGHRPASVLNRYRKLGAMNLSATERLALEMAVHEETERRAMDGELVVLQRAWREAEEIARICDSELTSPPSV
jgi:hypothetical protein